MQTRSNWRRVSASISTSLVFTPNVRRVAARLSPKFCNNRPAGSTDQLSEKVACVVSIVRRGPPCRLLIIRVEAPALLAVGFHQFLLVFLPLAKPAAALFAAFAS